MAALAAALITAPGVSAQGKLPPYPDALRCAGLTSAANNIGKGTKESSQLFDHLIFWSMTAADAGRAAGKNARQVDADTSREATAAEARLRAQDGGTSAALADCVRRVTPLDK
ncbi:hypothetical protein [Sphingomonas turrisvirgatae]|uniref:Uncharacterized protein n=1 Tax=Sphingomonas turrisvirgatae TaxID=1888892 RepID=A0A1E3LQT8_9SPHN|nr:hypothetical protein [Sphingomonas turrisvirgatae]ODP36132.1 hypothetical protein BFL28_06895 [Sphingomonas turrisvirgatae]